VFIVQGGIKKVRTEISIVIRIKLFSGGDWKIKL